MVEAAAIGEDDAVMLTDGIGAVTQPVFQGAFCRLARRFEDGPVCSEQPAVIAASYPLGVDLAVLEGRAAMRTMQLQQSTAPLRSVARQPPFGKIALRSKFAPPVS